MYSDTMQAISDFCLGESPFNGFSLDKVKDYRWPLKGPSVRDLLRRLIPDSQLSGRTNYEQNISLKEFMTTSYATKGFDAMAASTWIVHNWGGIPRVSKNMHEYLEFVKRKEYPTYLEGVASYSKLFAMFYSKEFAIYDARVAVSLNIIQLLSAKKNAIFFPYLAGRNKITGDNRKKRGFKYVKDFSLTALRESQHQTWASIKRADTYPKYNQILREVSGSLSCDLSDIEMLLFSQAEELVHAIRNDKKFQDVDWTALD